MTYRTVTVEARIADSIVAVSPEINANIEVDAEMANLIRTTNYEEYSGETVVTPSAEVQVLQTGNRVVLENITINPIPSNYGLITWNGAVLTVS